MPHNLFQKIDNVVLETSNVKLINYSLGKCKLNCKYINKQRNYIIEFDVIETGNKTLPLLGLKASIKKHLIKRLNKVEGL